MNRFHLSLPVIAAAAALVTSAESIAETVPRAEEVIVTASRFEVGLAGASTTVIEADEIAASPAQTLPELLALRSGIQARDLYGGTSAARATVDLRGFGATANNNTLILLDGRRLNDIDIAAIDFSNIPRESIARIEILRGTAGGVLYGDGAVGGVVNIITKVAPGTRPKASAAVAVGSDGWREGNVTVARETERASANAFIAYVDGDGYRRNNDILQRNLIAELRRSGDAGDIFVKIGRDEQRLGLPGARLVTLASSDLDSDRRGAATPLDYANQDGGSLTVGLTHRLGPGAELALDAGVRSKEQSASIISPFGTTFDEFVATTLTTWSATPRITLDHRPWGVGTRTIAGIDYYYADYDSDRKNNLSAPPVHRYDGKQKSLAAYAQNTFGLGPATDLSLGLRLQRVETVAGDIFDASAPGVFGSGHEALDKGETHYAANLGIEHRLAGPWAVFGRVGRNFRLPTIDERIGGSSGASFELSTQISEDGEVGARYGGARLDAQVSAYVMELKNELHFDPDNFVNRNFDATRRVGLEASAGHRLTPRLRIQGDLAHTRAEFTSGVFVGKDIPLVAPWTAAATLAWDAPAGVTLGTTLSYVAEKRLENDEANTQPRIPGYTLADLKASGRYRRFRWTAAVNNLFDQDYYNYGVASTATQGRYNAYPLPGRTFRLSAAIVF